MKPELALALIMKRWRDWQNIVHHQLPHQQQAERLNFIRLYKLYKKIKENESKKCQHQENPSMKRSAPYSLIEVSIKKKKIVGKYPLEICKEPVPQEKYYDYIRMDMETYYELLKLVQLKLQKQKWVKDPVPPHVRLQICLRYLASGESMLMISYEFETSPNTVSKIVTETCQVIWDVLKDNVLPEPNNNLWKEKAEQFESQLDFPHCIGAICGKQLLFQTPFYSGPNGKDKGNLAFFGIIDTKCCFTYLSIGIENILDNSIVFSKSRFGRDIKNNALNIPLSTKQSEKNENLPYVLVSNKDYPLTINILQSYITNESMELAEQVFNKKVDQVIKYANNAFDILTSQWKIFHKKLSTNSSNTIKIVRTIVCLHNFIMRKEITKPLLERQYAVVIEGDVSNYVQGCIDVFMEPEEPSNEARKMRDKFKKYFCEVKSITMQDWQSA